MATPEVWDNAMERLRRERSDTEGLQSNQAVMPEKTIDYGAAGLKIDRAMHHMDESIPNKQKKRTELAFFALREGMLELEFWLRSNGYEV